MLLAKRGDEERGREGGEGTLEGVARHDRGRREGMRENQGKKGERGRSEERGRRERNDEGFPSIRMVKLPCKIEVLTKDGSTDRERGGGTASFNRRREGGVSMGSSRSFHRIEAERDAHSSAPFLGSPHADVSTGTYPEVSSPPSVSSRMEAGPPSQLPSMQLRRPLASLVRVSPLA